AKITLVRALSCVACSLSSGEIRGPEESVEFAVDSAAGCVPEESSASASCCDTTGLCVAIAAVAPGAGGTTTANRPTQRASTVAPRANTRDVGGIKSSLPGPG